MLPHLRVSFPPLSLFLAASLSPVSAAETGTLAGQPVTVLSRSVVMSPNGSTTYVRIRPPALPPRPAPPPPAPEAPLSPELQAALERAEAKPYATLALTATVYTRADGSSAVTLLAWRDGERGFTAWSNADWRLLRQLNDIETETHRFQYFPFIDAQPLAELPTDQRPAGLALFPAAPVPGALPEYYLEGGADDAAATEPVLAALDQLHAHVHLHREQLVADLARREADVAEQARRAAIEAARPKHDTIYFWKAENPAPASP
jgi:hypothetical protein